MAQIINLNKKRKIKKRQEKEKVSALNRIKFGRTKQEQLIAKNEKEQTMRHLEGHKLETSADIEDESSND